MATPQQTPLQQVAETVADTAPKLAIAAKAIALEDHRRMLREHAGRVADSHRAMAKAIGMEDAVVLASEEDAMGHLIVTGDINVSDPAALQGAINALAGKQSPSPSPAPAQATDTSAAPAAPAASTATPFWQKALVSAAMVASGAGAGAGIPWLLGAFDEPAAVATPTFEDKNTQYELHLGTGEETPTPATGESK
jgi:hypothetical protein